MRKSAAILFLIPVLLQAQQPIGPVSGGIKGLQSFSFQNSNGFVGSVTNTNQNITLSLALGNQAVALNQIVNIGSNSILGNNTGSSGPILALTPTNVLDIIGSTRGSILYRGASGWSILAPGTSGFVLTSNGSGADPTFTANPASVSSVSIGNLSPLFTASVATATTTPAISFTLSNAAAHTWFGNPTGSSAAPAFNATVVPAVMLGSGSDGSGNHALFDDGTYKTLTGGGSVSTFSAGNLSPLFTSSVANATTTPALTFAISNAAGNSWFGNATGSSAAPAFNTSAIPSALIPALTGDVTKSSGSATTTIANSAVTYAKIQNVAANSILGNPNGSGAAPIEITLGGGLSFSSGKLRSFNASQPLSAYAIDVSTAKSFYKTLTAGTNTFTWSNFADGDSIVVRCKQVASGSVGTVVFPTAGADGAHTTFWQSGTQPTQTTTFNASDFYECHNQNSDVYCAAMQNFH